MPSISSAQPSSQEIHQMFDRLARRYDLFNHLTSAGLAVLWRRKALEPVEAGMRVLDLGCGTGDLSLGALEKAGEAGEVVGLDFSRDMLRAAESRLRKKRASLASRCRFVRGKAEELPLAEPLFDAVVSGFVLRNLYENIDSILEGVHASLKPGGFVSLLDIVQAERALPNRIWRAYMGTLGALYGRMLFGKDYPDMYLVESAARFPKARAFADKLRRTGFRNVRVRFFMMGLVALYQAEK